MKSLNIALLTFFRPASAFRLIKKDREKFNYAATFIIAALAVVSRVFGVAATHAPFAAAGDAALGREVSTVLLLFFSAAAATYLVTTIMGGESMFREVLAAAAYALLPYILFNAVIAAASNVLSLTDYSVYSTAQTIVYIWVGALYLVSLSVMNSYKAGETVKIALIALFGCVFLWTVAALAYMLGVKLFGFVGEVVSEYRILFGI